MGCRLMRGETIYFLMNGGPASAPAETEGSLNERELRLLPPVYTNSEGRRGASSLSVIPVDVQCLDPA